MANQAAGAAKPATTTAEERFPGNAPTADIDGVIQLRIDAGAIKSSKAKDPKTGEWVVTTVWNVIGGNA